MQQITVSLKFNLHENQKKIHDSPARFKIVKAGKRFGKTKWALFEIAQMAGKIPNGTFWYIAPTYGMAKDIAWRDLKLMLPKSILKKVLETELSIELINNSLIRLKGADNPDSLRGSIELS